MAYKVSVVTKMDRYNEPVYATWWNRLDKQLPRNISFHRAINQMLKQYNGRDIDNSYYIEFDTEEDYLMFRMMTDSYATIATQ